MLVQTILATMKQGLLQFILRTLRASQVILVGLIGTAAANMDIPLRLTGFLMLTFLISQKKKIVTVVRTFKKV